MKTQQLTVTNLGSLIEGLFGRLIPVASLRSVLGSLDSLFAQTFDDEDMRDGSHKYSADVRMSYPTPEKPIADMDECELNEWISAFWSWREMLTPDDFAKLNDEPVVLSEVSPV